MINLLLISYNLLTLTRNANLMYCDIKGNVKNPGVYLVEEGDIINDIILKAGGLKKNSYVKNINLSKKVTDEMVINIMTIDEFESINYECPVCDCQIPECTEQMTTTKEIITTKEITTSTTNTTLPETSSTTTITTSKKILVNINTATLEELIKLPGVGGVIGTNIIEYRKEYIFSKIEDILNVKGIGEKLFDKIKEYIIV